MKSNFDFESTSFGEFAFSSWGFGEDVFTVVAGDDRLGMAENDWSLVASSAFDVHEVGVGSGHQSFQFVLFSLLFEGGVENIAFHGDCWLVIKNIIYHLHFKIGI